MDPPAESARLRPSITLSRQAYSGAHFISEILKDRLEKDPLLGGERWELFDKELVDRILEDHDLPRIIARFMPEDRDHELSGLINELVGLHPSLWELFHYTCDTLLKLARVGNVILIGRGAHIVTRGLPAVARVRLIAPAGERIRRAAVREDISEKEAARLIRKDDAARQAYTQSHFNERIDDPLAYDLVLNTAGIYPETAADLILSVAKHHHQAARGTGSPHVPAGRS